MSVELPDSAAENIDPPIETEWNGDTPWWRPGFFESVLLLGWAWLLIIPVSGVLLFLVLAPKDPQMWTLMWIGWVKLIAAFFALPFFLSSFVFGKAIKSRTDPFCIHCGHTLKGLPDDHRCPECGRRYRFEIIEAYRHDPQSFAHRWKQREWSKPNRPAVNDRSKR